MNLYWPLKLKNLYKGLNYFSPKGKLALMFLKHYTCCSYERLIGQLNANIDYQFFCGEHSYLKLIHVTSDVLLSNVNENHIQLINEL